MAISVLKIRRSLGRVIFNMGIAIPGKTVFLIETAPRSVFIYLFFKIISLVIVDYCVIVCFVAVDFTHIFQGYITGTKLIFQLP